MWRNKSRSKKREKSKEKSKQKSLRKREKVKQKEKEKRKKKKNTRTTRRQRSYDEYEIEQHKIGFDSSQNSPAISDNYHDTPKPIISPKHANKPNNGAALSNSIIDEDYEESIDDDDIHDIDNIDDDDDENTVHYKLGNTVQSQSHNTNLTIHIHHDDNDISVTNTRSRDSQSSPSSSADSRQDDVDDDSNSINSDNTHSTTNSITNSNSNSVTDGRANSESSSSASTPDFFNHVSNQQHSPRPGAIENTKIRSKGGRRVSKITTPVTNATTRSGRGGGRNNKRKSLIGGDPTLLLQSIVSSQNEHKKRSRSQNSGRKSGGGGSVSGSSKKPLRFRPRRRNDSESASHNTNISMSMDNAQMPEAKKYRSIDFDSLGQPTTHARTPSQSANGSNVSHNIIPSHTNGNGSSSRKTGTKPPKIYGGGHMYDLNHPSMPYHLKAYYDIQHDLDGMRQSTKKKNMRMSLDAMNRKLHTLFFANERTHLPNLAAYQKFFLDRMSHKSVHGDLDWHICLIRPKMHSRMQHTQIGLVINVVADLLRKCMKKFNHRRGHITSSAKTTTQTVGIYRRGHQALSNAESEAILFPSPPKSAPPELYNNNPGSPRGLLEVHSIDNGNDTENSFISDSDDDYKNAANKKKNKKKKKRHRRLWSISGRKSTSSQSNTNLRSNGHGNPHNNNQPVHLALNGGTVSATGSRHGIVYNLQEPYPMELFHISDMEFVLVYYVKFLTKFEQLMVEFLQLYTQFSNLSDDLESSTQLILSLVTSDPKQTYLESMLRAQNTMHWGRQSREHAWMRVQTDTRKSRKFGQDLISTVQFMKFESGKDIATNLGTLHELMKQAPDLNTLDRRTSQSALQIALKKSKEQPQFSFVARFLAFKQLIYAQRLEDHTVIADAVKYDNPFVAEILIHLQAQNSQDLNLMKSYEDIWMNLYNSDLKALTQYCSVSNAFSPPKWHNTSSVRRWIQGSQSGDVVKLRSVLQRGFNINYCDKDTDYKTALIICSEKGKLEAVTFLLQFPTQTCNLNAKDLQLRTALHYAAMRLNGGVFRLLMEHGVNWTLRDLHGKQSINYIYEKIGFVCKPVVDGDTSDDEDGKDKIDSKNKHYVVSDVCGESGYDYLVDPIDQTANQSAISTETAETETATTMNVGVSYESVDAHELVKMLDVCVLTKVPLDNRLLLLCVQRDWPHVLLVLCNYLDIDVIGKDGITPLMLAAREGRRACLSAILQCTHPDLDRADSADRTPIMHAAYRGEAECVSRLLSAGANIDVETVDGTTLLMAACYGGLDSFCKYLIAHNADVDAVNENGFSALLFASSEGYQETVSLLLTANCSINVVSRAGLTPLMAGCSGGLHELVLYVLARINRCDMDLTDENGWTALMHAVASGSEKCAAILLKAGADVRTVGEDGYSLLSIAMMGNLIWMVRHILDTISADATSRSSVLVSMFNTQEHGNGFSCIHEACGIGAQKCLQILGAYNNKHNMIEFDLGDLNGRTPVMIACLNGHNDCVNEMMRNDIDLNKCDNNGNCVLIYAIESGDIDIVKTCVNKMLQNDSIDKHAINTAYNTAKLRKYQKIQMFLKQFV